ncbi:MAG: hypothetical protein ABR566_16615 [Pyrinomonadaceae bacterium]
MLHPAKNTNLNIRRTPLICSLLFAMVIALLPISAQAQCAKQWDGSGEWEIRQGTGAGTIVRLNLKQSGSALSGEASREVRAGERGGSATKTVTGKVIGDADGSDFSLQIDWSDMPGEFISYKGKILTSGRAEGKMFLNGSQTSRASWYSVQPLTCGWSPGKSRGNLTEPKPPFINAGQVIRPSPAHPYSVYLGWDGGPDHPGAQVWVSVNGGAETQVPSGILVQYDVFKQPKVPAIELRVPMELRGSTYKFVLKDGGKTLSTVVVPIH